MGRLERSGHTLDRRIVTDETIGARRLGLHPGVLGPCRHRFRITANHRQHDERRYDAAGHENEDPVGPFQCQSARSVPLPPNLSKPPGTRWSELATSARMAGMDLKRVDRVFRILPKEERYYELFDSLVRSVAEGCELLTRFFDEGADRVVLVESIKEVERRGDDATRNIMMRLQRSLVTPIDREDIQALATQLDDVLDDAYVAASFADASGLDETNEHLLALSDSLLACARELAAAVEHLNNRDGIREHCATVHKLESTADDQYRTAIRALFAGAPDAIRVIRLKELYDRIESGIDRCEDVANILEDIVAKNS